MFRDKSLVRREILACGGAKSGRTRWGAWRHHVRTKLEDGLLLAGLLRAVLRDRQALAAENLLLRQPLAILTRPTRKRARLRARDRLFWVLVQQAVRDWGRHLVLVRPATVIRWHR